MLTLLYEDQSHVYCNFIRNMVFSLLYKAQSSEIRFILHFLYLLEPDAAFCLHGTVWALRLQAS